MAPPRRIRIWAYPCGRPKKEKHSTVCLCPTCSGIGSLTPLTPLPGGSGRQYYNGAIPPAPRADSVVQAILGDVPPGPVPAPIRRTESREYAAREAAEVFRRGLQAALHLLGEVVQEPHNPPYDRINEFLGGFKDGQ